MIAILVNQSNQNIKDNNVSEFDMAPSVSEADEILARFGYEDAEVELLVA